MRRSFGLLTLAALVSSVLFAAPAPAGTLIKTGSADAAFASSPNVTHVANLPYELRYGNTSDDGTDIEVVTLDVQTGVDELTGEPIIETKDFALAGSYDNGLQIIDITDPTAPVHASVYDCAISQGDVQVFQREGRTYITYTDDDYNDSRKKLSACYQDAQALGFKIGNADGTFIADITDPYNPVTVSWVGFGLASHNQTVSPDGNFLYNSNSDLGTGETDGFGTIEVVDISDFSNPVRTDTLELVGGINSHDITFSADGKRAYSAAVTHTLVLDTTDLAHPEIIGRIVDPAINISHQSDPITLKDATTGLERTFLVITDEIAGASGNYFCPGGGLHIYDITGELEKAPVKVGFWNMPDLRPSGVSQVPGAGEDQTCTAHVLRMYPEQKLMTIAWYNAGVRVVDISGLIGLSVGAQPVGNVGAGMKEVGFFNFADSITWSVKTNKINEDGSFYMFGNDMNRGLDVYHFTRPTAAMNVEPGVWLTPAQALKKLGPNVGPVHKTKNAPFCLLPR